MTEHFTTKVSSSLDITQVSDITHKSFSIFFRGVTLGMLHEIVNYLLDWEPSQMLALKTAYMGLARYPENSCNTQLGMLSESGGLASFIFISCFSTTVCTTEIM